MFRVFIKTILLGLIPTVALATPNFKTIDPDTFDFGTAAQGDIITHTFKFENAGTSPLEILSVKGSCGCTAAMVSERTIAPGKTGQVQVEFDTKEREGHQHKSVTLLSNDPDEMQFVYFINGEVNPPLSMSHRVFAPQMTPNETVRDTIQISNHAPYTINFKEVTITRRAPIVKVTADLGVSSLSSGEQTTLIVAVAANTIGVAYENIEITTDHPVMDKLGVRINARIEKNAQ